MIPAQIQAMDRAGETSDPVFGRKEPTMINKEGSAAVPSEKDCYSLDEENFNYTDLWEVLQALDDQDELKEGATFYEGEAHHKAPSYYFDVDSLIESMGERAYDDAGEWADTFPDLPKEKVAELQGLVAAWLDANVTHTFYTVLNTRKVTVTAEMIAEHQAPNPAQIGGAA